MTLSEEEERQHGKERLREWLAIPRDERVPRTKNELAEELNITRQTLHKWESELDQDVDFNAWLKSHSKDAHEGLIAGCKRGNPQALRLYYQLRGLLTDKGDSAELPEFSANDYFRLEFGADEKIRRVLAETGGGKGVQEESPILPDEVREDSA